MYQEYPIPTISSLGEGSNSTPGPPELWSPRAQDNLLQLLQTAFNRLNVHLNAFPLKTGCAFPLKRGYGGGS